MQQEMFHLKMEVLWKPRFGIQVWIILAGQERYQAITAAHYRRSVGAIIVFDVMKSSSFENVSKWLNSLQNNAEKDTVIMLVWNKTDLCRNTPKERKVSREDAELFCKKNNLLYEETSAYSNEHIKESFETLMESIVN